MANPLEREDDRAGGAAWPSAEHLLRDGAAVVAGGGALLYGVIALAYDRFYRVLGISPEAVGVTQSAIVARTAIVLGLLAAVVVATYSGVFLAIALVRRRWSTATVGLVSAGVAVPLGALLIAWSSSPVLFEDSSREYTITVVASLTAAALLTLALRRRAGGRAIVACWAAAIGIAYVNVVNGTTSRAAELAEGVLGGEPIPPRGLTFMYNVHADPVCVTETTAATREYGLYLGESGDWIAIYDPTVHRTERRSRRGLTLAYVPSSIWPESHRDLESLCEP